MNPNAAAAANHYISKGIAKVPAVGMVAVLDAGESQLNPVSENNSGTEHGGVLNPNGSYGIAQWNGSRQQDLLNFATKKGLNPADLNTQLDFVLTESWNSYPAVKDAILQPGIDLSDFITVFVEKYEVPANPSPEIARSLAEAQALLPLVGLPTPPPSPTPIDPASLASVLAALQSVISLLQALISKL